VVDVSAEFVVVATVSETVPAAADGEEAVIEVYEAVPVLVTAAPPNFTELRAAVEENPSPVTVTDVPPAVGPLVGAIDVTMGMTASVAAFEVVGVGVGVEGQPTPPALKL
jgi:hypothetical protein